MVPGDTDDIKKEYEILLRELTAFNPELLDKQRVLAVTKSDLLDDELQQMLSADLPQDVPCIFISAVAGKGIMELKDLLWKELNSESNKLAAITSQENIVHRNKDIAAMHREMEDEGEDEELLFLDEEDLEDVEEDWEEEDE